MEKNYAFILFRIKMNSLTIILSLKLSMSSIYELPYTLGAFYEFAILLCISASVNFCHSQKWISSRQSLIYENSSFFIIIWRLCHELRGYFSQNIVAFVYEIHLKKSALVQVIHDNVVLYYPLLLDSCVIFFSFAEQQYAISHGSVIWSNVVWNRVKSSLLHDCLRWKTIYFQPFFRLKSSS